MNTESKIESMDWVKQNLVHCSKERGIYPSFLAKTFFKEIERARDHNFSLDDVVWAEGVADGAESGLVFRKDAEKYKRHDFYFIDYRTGTVYRWFPGMEIIDMITDAP